ncbi:unnamed protein product [Closterium sp. Yama58-4]|nr:unnamed protein product [Closterium sp. Yama58-4]
MITDSEPHWMTMARLERLKRNPRFSHLRQAPPLPLVLAIPLPEMHHGDILERIPAWRHDVAALKAKFNRLKAEWRRINDRIKRSGEGHVTNLPPWYHLDERLWGERPSTVPSVLASTGLPPAGRATARSAPPTATNTRATPTTVPSTLPSGTTIPTVAAPLPLSSSTTPTTAARTVTAPLSRVGALTTPASNDSASAPLMQRTTLPRPPAPVAVNIPTVVPAPSPSPSRNAEPGSPGQDAGALAPSRHTAETPLSPDTITPSNGGSPSGGTHPLGATTSISIRGRRLTWGARPSSNGGEGCSRNAWWQYPRKQDAETDGKKKNAAKRIVGRKAAEQKKPSTTAELVGDLGDHFDKRQDEKWEEFKSLTREVFRGYADERHSRRRRSPQSTSSSEDEE